MTVVLEMLWSEMPELQPAIDLGTAKVGSAIIILILPFVYLVGISSIEGGDLTLGLQQHSNTLVMGVITSVLGGLIVHAVTKRR